MIANSADGAFPALADALMRIDNRVGNQGRANLGLSAKHMGDAICLDRGLVLEHWREHGLVEDYALRQRLLLAGVRIEYAPEAISWGEAPVTWQAARTQRSRWLSGTIDSSRTHAGPLLGQGLRARDRAMLDGAAQAMLPAYSTLVVLTSVGACASALLALRRGEVRRSGSAGRPGRGRDGVAGSRALPSAARWLALLASLTAYPIAALVIDRAPARVFRALAVGPIYVVWRTALAARTRLSGRTVEWRRTQRRGEVER